MNIIYARRIAKRVEAFPTTHGISIEERAKAYNRLEDITKTKERSGKSLFEVWEEDKALALILFQNACEHETCDFPDLKEYYDFQNGAGAFQNPPAVIRDDDSGRERQKDIEKHRMYSDPDWNWSGLR